MIQALALLGAVLILLPFAASQLGHLEVESRRYQALNLAGSAALTVVAVVQRQYGFIVLEAAWALMSAVGLGRVLRRGRTA
jgi:hypothetical protein